VSWLQILSLMTAATVVNATFEPGPPVPVEDAEVLQLDKERYQRLTVPVTIQGKGPYRFMIDTGAEATVVSTDLAALLITSDRRPAIIVGMASRVATESISIEDFNLGSRSFYIATAALIDGSNLGQADGILGLDSLQDQRILLDFHKDEMSVADAQELGGNRGFEIVVKARRRLGQLIIARASLDGIDTTVIIDTGAQASIGNPALLERLRRNRNLGETELTDINGHKLSGTVRVAGELNVGRMSLRNFPVLFVDSPPFHSLGLSDTPSLILGMKELRLFRRVAIDFKSRQILFDLPRGTYGFDSMYGRRLGV